MNEKQHKTCLRTREDLVEAMDCGLRPKWMFFWGHKPAADGSITKTCFSQWWQGHGFEVEGDFYQTAEHFMMAEKARLFADREARQKILQVTHPGEAKKLGRTVRGFDDSLWREKRMQIVVQGSVAKFSQHEDLKQFLLTTGDRVIVEASPRDRIWGIGMGASNPHAENPRHWRGGNLLGFALMQAREILHAEQENEP